MSQRYAIVVDGIVTNVVLADPDFAAAQGWVTCGATVQPGDLHVDGEFVRPAPPPPPAPRSLSRNGFANVVVAATAADFGSEEAAALHLDDVEEAMKASADQLERVFWKRYDRARDIDFADMGPVWALWQVKGHYSTAQISAIQAVWLALP